MDTCVDFAPEEYIVTDDHPLAGSSRNTLRQDLVQSLVRKHRVVIFSKSQCPYCQHSKTLLSNFGVKFVTVELDQVQEGNEMQTALGEITGVKTVPRIFINGKCIGGSNDLSSLKKSGQLKDLLKDV
ncbi:unnamed protein product [Candidula unifasciata]|uniref:Glutaredoxin-2, mitochondrial n=1 Tax=Candidula unifasciata TaxID=100452 RepID=A0A8S3YMT8_9EUPU|nr:unnamed protein product [Candidula unifasciata]